LWGRQRLGQRRVAEQRFIADTACLTARQFLDFIPNSTGPSRESQTDYCHVPWLFWSGPAFAWRSDAEVAGRLLEGMDAGFSAHSWSSSRVMSATRQRLLQLCNHTSITGVQCPGLEDPVGDRNEAVALTELRSLMRDISAECESLSERLLDVSAAATGPQLEGQLGSRRVTC
jgi:hypothetical protein